MKSRLSQRPFSKGSQRKAQVTVTRARGTARPVLNSRLKQSQHDHGLHSSRDNEKGRVWGWGSRKDGKMWWAEMRKAAVPSDARQARGGRVERTGQGRGERVERNGLLVIGVRIQRAES
jgi:hypothetical protein